MKFYKNIWHTVETRHFRLEKNLLFISALLCLTFYLFRIKYTTKKFQSAIFNVSEVFRKFEHGQKMFWKLFLEYPNVIFCEILTKNLNTVL